MIVTTILYCMIIFFLKFTPVKEIQIKTMIFLIQISKYYTKCEGKSQSFHVEVRELIVASLTLVTGNLNG